MAFSTYSELKTSIANFLARDDLTAQIPDFIRLAEARMSRELDARSMEKRATATTVAGDSYISLPTDLREIRNVQLNTDPVKTLDYYTVQMINTDYAGQGQGKPKAYSIVGTEILLKPTPDAAYTLEIVYGENVQALSDEDTNNTIPIIISARI